MTNQRLTVPRIYPDSGPLRWQDDQTGVLPDAVRTFFHQPGSITREQLRLLTDYSSYYIEAPCWFTTGMEDAFLALRKEIVGITEVSHLRNWLSRALEVGIDPF